jgi:hypothetical protein
MQTHTMTNDPEERRAQEIAELVDAMLVGRGESAAESADSELRKHAARELKVALALRGGGPAPPLSLLTGIERQVRAARDEAPAKPRLRLPSLQRPAFASMAVGLAAVVAVVVVVVSSGGSSNGSSLNQAAALAFKPSVTAAPQAHSATLLDVAYHGVTYPNYAARFGSHPTGVRTDRIGGHRVLTVFYRLRNGTRLSYSVFAGSPVSVPSNATATTFDGVTLNSYRTASGLSVVTLVRHGRTCVLAAHGASVNTLLAFAEWPLTVTPA